MGGVVNEKRFLSQLKVRLKDCYLQIWCEQNANNDRYSWYSTFKENFGLEHYLNTLEIKKFRDVFVRFRFGINDLRINDRYTNTHDRKCPFCDEIEDEIHFLFKCPVYEHLRKKHFEQQKRKQTNNCTFLMQSKNKRVRSIAMYIFYAFKLRQQKLELLSCVQQADQV